MIDIQKMIEEEINNSFNQDLFKAFSGFEILIAKTEFRNGALFALSELQHANRWRKVSEELPIDQGIVLVKTDKDCFATAYRHGKESGFIVYGDDAYKEFGNITEWKPIE